jgi:hypothetical protein
VFRRGCVCSPSTRDEPYPERTASIENAQQETGNRKPKTGKQAGHWPILLNLAYADIVWHLRPRRLKPRAWKSTKPACAGSPPTSPEGHVVGLRRGVAGGRLGAGSPRIHSLGGDALRVLSPRCCHCITRDSVASSTLVHEFGNVSAAGTAGPTSASLEICEANGRLCLAPGAPGPGHVTQ